MSIKGRKLMFLIYLVVLLLGTAYTLTGNYITHYWKFGPEYAILYSGNRKLLLSELNLIYAGFCLSLFSSIVYCITRIEHKIKNLLLLTSFILGVLIYVFPETITIIVVLPIMTSSLLGNLIGIHLGSDFITMSILVTFTLFIYLHIIKIFKNIVVHTHKRDEHSDIK